MVCAFATLVACSAFAVGCATGSAGDSSPGDGGQGDSTTADAPRGDATPCPTGHTGPSCQNCSSGFHACGSTCEQDHPNDPDAGCTQGCNNTPCPAPQNGTAKCTSDGHCDFACNTSFDKSDAGCDCPSAQIICTGVCQPCCVDSDCPNHLACQSGTCAGCQAGWGACNGDPTNCETQLNSSSHCGSCGNSCCSSFCGRGFLGTGGKSCKPSGSSYSCQC